MTKPTTGRPAVDLTGQRFGQLKVLRATTERSSNRGMLWRCLCQCGALVTARSDRLRAGRMVNCGCAARKWEEEFWEMAKRIVR